jgi:hypothetical protein
VFGESVAIRGQPPEEFGRGITPEESGGGHEAGKHWILTEQLQHAAPQHAIHEFLVDQPRRGGARIHVGPSGRGSRDARRAVAIEALVERRSRNPRHSAGEGIAQAFACCRSYMRERRPGACRQLQISKQY